MCEEATTGSTDEEGTVMVSIDRTGRVPIVVIADVSTDDAWVSILASEAPDLPRWR